MNTVAIENESLRAQIEEQNRLFSDQIIILKDELNMKIEETKIRTNYDQTMIKNLETKLQKKENHLLESTKEYFAFKVKSSENEKRLHEENEILRLRNAALAQKILIFTKQHEIDHKVSKELSEKRTEEYTNKYRSQIRNKEESLQLIKVYFSLKKRLYNKDFIIKKGSIFQNSRDLFRKNQGIGRKSHKIITKIPEIRTEKKFRS